MQNKAPPLPASPVFRALLLCSPLSHRVLAHPATAPPRGEPSVSPWVKVRFVVRESPKKLLLTTSFGPENELALASPGGEVACRASDMPERGAKTHNNAGAGLSASPRTGPYLS